MNRLYPAIKAYATHRIPVDDMHELYVEESGNPQGIPVIFLHGGPGSGCRDAHRRLFNPDQFRTVLFDQRGSGKSLPLGETSRNTTQHLVADMEKIRRDLAIDQWMIFAGSWGATLGLVYAIENPQRVSAMVLRGLFLARESDLRWFFHDLKRLFPEAWRRFTQGVAGCDKLGDLFNWFRDRVKQNDITAANRWSAWGGTVVNWHRAQGGGEDENGKAATADAENLLAKVRIETHYACNRYFLQPNQILDHAPSLAGIPTSIVHGRFDLVCNREAAWSLHRAIPGAHFIEVAEAGHLLEEPAMASALMQEMERLGELL